MDEFDENDLKLIQTTKRTLKILAKVINDLEPKEVITDEDLAELIRKKGLENDPAKVAKALADPELGPMIRDRLTPDLPQLNAQQEAEVIGQLAQTIFAELLKAG